ncbi:hypothetical protein ACFQVC_41530 [Streptomyces monticola]|uniref:YqcI/YcgG family protein n=1 Tax=Streptomyces monticola TaxID=2666263 RepID=A0ABW2JY93_9ACTN
MSFDDIVNATYCPFAKPSRMGRPVTLTAAGLDGVEKELRGHRDTLADFFRTARAKRLDGMVITFDEPTIGASLAALTVLTRRFYTTLADLYTSVYIDEEPVPDQPWYAMIEGERFFLVSFAPCYPSHSPRHTHGDPRTYFLLQPASTFERHTAAIERLRPRIHRSFEAAGKPYDAKLANVENDMFKAVMPIDPLDRHIAWWDAQDS